MKNIYSFSALLVLLLLSSCDVALTRNDSSGEYGYYDGGVSKSGSLASFAIAGDNLFTIIDGELRSYDISTPEDTITMVQAAVTDAYYNKIGNLETIYPYGSHLFLGATDGMYIIDVRSPSSPKFVSRYEHVVSCDPVVVDSVTAYVTLRDGNGCGGDVNELQVIDISDLSKPVEIKSYGRGSALDLASPYGLGVDGDLLFVCDDYTKLKVMDCSDPMNIRLIQVFNDITATDVIPHNGVLVVLGEGELRQYAYENNKLTLLSTISNK